MSWISTIVCMCAAMAFYAGVYHLSLFFNPPRERANLSFALLCFFVGIYDLFCAALYSAADTLEGAFWQRNQFFSISFMLFFTVAFAYDFLKIDKKKRLVQLAAILTPVTLINYFTPLGIDDSSPAVKEITWLDLTYNESDLGIGNIVLYLIIISLMVYVFVLFRRQYIKGDKTVRPIVYGFLSFFLACINDMFVGAAVYPFIYLAEYGYLFVLWGMATSIQMRFVETYLVSEQTNLRQARILETIKRTQPALEAVVEDLSQISTAVATQSSEHTVTIEEVDASLGSVEVLSNDTVRAAMETRKIAETTKDASVASRVKLQGVEKDFELTMPSIEMLQEDIGGLAQQIDKTEEILGFINEISQQTSILAINAAIQAARAGNQGKGFRVVAQELRKLIKTTDEYLDRSRGLLEEIRQKSKVSAKNAANTCLLLEKQVKALRGVGAVIGNIVDSYISTTEKVDFIANAAEKQRSAIVQVASGMGHLKTAADELSYSAEMVLGNINKLASARRALDEILGDSSK